MPLILPVLFMFDAAWKGRYRKMTIVSTVVICAFAAWNFAFGQAMNVNSNTTIVAGAFIMLHCVLFYYHLLVNLPVQKLSRLPMFWFNAAYLNVL